MILLESTFDKILARSFPVQFPDWLRSIIAEWAWVIVIGVVIVQPLISLGYWEDMHAYGVHPNVLSYISLLVTTCAMAMQIIAIPFLKNLKRTGWILLYFSAFMTLLYGVIRVFSAEQSVGPLFGMTLIATIFLYALFQVRSHFKSR